MTPVLTCANGGTDVIDAECGLVAVSKADKCHFIGWFSRKDTSAMMKVGVGLEDEYNALGDQRCGYAKAREPRERPPRDPPMQRRLDAASGTTGSDTASSGASIAGL